MLNERLGRTRTSRSDPWLLLLLLSLTMAVGVMPSLVFGPLGPFVVDEFDMSLATLGLLTTSFNIGTGVMSRAAGRGVDRFGARQMTVLMLLATAIAAAAIWLAPAVWMLLIATLIGGCAFAAANPATNISITSLFSRKKRPIALGTKQAGVSVGSLIAGVVLPRVALELGWRAAVGFLGIAALLVALVIWVFLPNAERSPIPTIAEPPPRSMRVLAMYAFFTACGTSSFLAYLAIYLQQDAGFSITRAGLAYGIAGGIAIAGRVFWGWGFDPVFASRSSAGLLLIAVAGVVASALVLLASTVPVVVWIAVVVLGTCVLSWSALFAVAVASLAGTNRPATSSGLAYTGFYLGLGVSPPVFGVIVDATGSFASGWIMTIVCFCAAGYTALRIRPYEAAALAAPANQP